ncbi:hypothetical protein PG997_008642 [Apiospora hydei]|uniref:Uncharacterized protein n=1 Tax=Apiospora hydei TaxID=1337664 RepID=A0ABR1WF73_9PEZI
MAPLPSRHQRSKSRRGLCGRELHHLATHKRGITHPVFSEYIKITASGEEEVCRTSARRSRSSTTTISTTTRRCLCRTYAFPNRTSGIINAELLEVNTSLAHTPNLARSRWTRAWAACVLRNDTAIETNRYDFDTMANRTLYKLYISAAAPKSSAFVFPSYGTSVNVPLVHPGQRPQRPMGQCTISALGTLGDTPRF